jgi:hypothetical protein
VWNASGGGELLRRRDWSAGAFATLEGRQQVELDAFDSHFPTASLWVDRRLGDRWSARLQGDFGYAWVGGEPYVQTWDGTLLLERDGRRLGRTALVARGGHADFFFRADDVPGGTGGPGTPCAPGVALCGPPGLDESAERNRDGSGFEVGVAHSLSLPWRVPGSSAPILASGGYRYLFYGARGSEYTHQGHELRAALGSPLALGVVADVGASIAWLPYRDPSTFPDPGTVVSGIEYALSSNPRSDRLWRVELLLERPLAPRVSVLARYLFERNDSNVAVYDTERQIFGVTLRVAIGN